MRTKSSLQIKRVTLSSFIRRSALRDWHNCVINEKTFKKYERVSHLLDEFKPTLYCDSLTFEQIGEFLSSIRNDFARKTFEDYSTIVRQYRVRLKDVINEYLSGEYTDPNTF